MTSKFLTVIHFTAWPNIAITISPLCLWFLVKIIKEIKISNYGLIMVSKSKLSSITDESMISWTIPKTLEFFVTSLVSDECVGLYAAVVIPSVTNKVSLQIKITVLLETTQPILVKLYLW